MVRFSLVYESLPPYPRFPYWGFPGYGYGFPMTKDKEREMLEQNAKALEEELDRIRKKLEEPKERETKNLCGH